MAESWTPVSEAHPLPRDGQDVEVITPGGDQRDLIFDRGLWWTPDHAMYCYFVPTYWRPR